MASLVRGDTVRRSVGWFEGLLLVLLGLTAPCTVSAQHVEIPRPDLMGPAGLFLHQSWTAQGRTLPDLSVTHLSAANNGLLLVAMSHGTYYFDGLTFTPLWHPLTSGATGVVSLGGDRVEITTLFRRLRGSLCCGAPASNTAVLTDPDGNLSRAGDPTTALHLDDLLAVGDTTLMIADRRHRLIRVEPDGRMETIPVPTGELLRSFTGHGRAQYLAGHDLYRLQGTQLTRLTMPATVATRLDITAMAVAPDDGLVLGTASGDVLQCRVVGHELRLIRRAAPAGVTPVSAVLVDNAGAVWVGFADAGIAEFDGHEWRRAGSREGLSGDGVRALVADAEGDVWVGTEGGLDRFRPREVRVLARTAGLSSVNVHGLALSADSTLIATVEGNQVQRLEGTRGFRPVGGHWGHIISAMLALRDGSTLLGFGSQLVRMSPAGHFTDVSIPEDANHPHGQMERIASLAEGVHGELWVGLEQRRGLLRQWRDGTIERFDATRGIDFTWTFGLGLDDRHDVWAFGPEGVARRSGGDFRRVWSVPQGEEITFATVDHDVVWVGVEDGLYIAVDGEFHRLEGADVPHDAVQSFVNDHRGHVWLGGGDGLWRIDRAGALQRARTGHGDLHARRFDRFDGLLSEEFNTGGSPRQVHTMGGRVFFATAGGLLVADPAWVARNPAPPQPQLTRVTIGDSTLVVPDSLTQPLGAGVVTFEFTVPALRAPEKTRVEYRLDGVDRDWKTAGLNRRVVYGGLKGRTYRFRLRAFNEDGVPSRAEATVRVRLVPPLTQRWPFRLFAALALAAMVWTGVRLRERQLRRRQRQLQRLVDERTSELREMSARRLDSIGRLAGGVAHDLNSLLTVVMGNAHLLHDDVPVPLKPEVQEIIGAAERAGRLTAQLLTFASRQIVLPAQFDLGDAIRGLRERVQRVVGPAVVIELIHDGTPLPVFADRPQIEQVVVNLAENARDAMPDGGTLRIRLWREERPEAPGRPEGTWIVLDVEDTGVGMGRDVLQHLFEPFFTTKSVGQGTGMGLATTYGIVQQWGGFIEVMSELGLGSTFRVSLPLLVQPPAAVADQAAVVA